MDKPSIRVIGFRTTYTKRDGMAELVARDLVKYSPVHAINTVTEEFVSHLRPPENGLERDDAGLKAGHMQALWSQIEPHYEAWKKGTEVPETGVPLSAWAGVTVEQADVLRKSNIRTVEDLSEIGDNQLSRIMLPNARSLKQMATEFLASRGTAESAAKVTALEEQNAVLKARLDEMAGMIAERLGKADDEVSEKRRPGRPRKPEQAEEAA